VIVWLNGTFGAGKTVTAAALVPLIPEARLFDPETVGYMLRPNLADHPVPDFQDWAPWRALVVATATELARYTGEHLIAAQTILNRDYLAEIVTGLRAAGVAVFHVLLDASDGILRRRIEASEEARQWRLDHLTEYRQARRWLCHEADLVLDTAALTAAQAAREIARALPSLGTPDRPRPPARTPET
jgi:chloramphenicol 3-O-phosphotransferase